MAAISSNSWESPRRIVTAESRSDEASSPEAVRNVVPGVLACGAIAAIAAALDGIDPVVGAPVIAILIGIAISAVRAPSARWSPGIVFSAKRVLQGSIVLLGLGLSYRQVLSSGVQSLPVLIGTLSIALLAAWALGKKLGLRRDLNVLIGVGTAICGASAIAAADAVIDADGADVSYAVATIFTFNVTAVLLYPTIGHALGLSPRSFGLWSGTAINDVSSVVAAASVYGGGAVSSTIVVKLTRTLAIIPICLALAIWRNRPGTAVPAMAGERPARDASNRGATRRSRVPLRKIFPLFVVAFAVAVGINSSGVIPPTWHHSISDLATFAITSALAGIGLSTSIAAIRVAGPRPILAGAMLWIVVGAASLGLQLLTASI